MSPKKGHTGQICQSELFNVKGKTFMTSLTVSFKHFGYLPLICRGNKA
jgi:hypothetical protein